MWSWYGAVLIASYMAILSLAIPGIFVAAAVFGGEVLLGGLVASTALGAAGMVIATGSLVELRRSRRPSLLLAGGRRGRGSLPKAPRNTARRAVLFAAVAGALTAGVLAFLMVPVLPLALAILATHPGKPKPWHPKPQRPT